jgi:hypothetical protein
VDTRRGFLTGLIVTGISGEIAGRLAVAQTPSASQEKPGKPELPADTPPLPSVEKRILDENEKDIKKKVGRLYELATELKAEVDKTDSSKVLSLNLLKKAEEIEKLARDIKNRSKG